MAKQPAIVTADSIDIMLGNANRNYVAATIGRALSALLLRQTTEEQSCSATLAHNGIGFTGADAHSATLTARYWKRHGVMLDWQIEAWSKQAKNGHSRLAKYHRQLNQIAVERQQHTLPLIVS